jgi:hypothetical protein
VGLEVYAKTMDDRQFVRVKGKQILVFGYEIVERSRYSLKNGLSIREAMRWHEDIPARELSP